ncbi:MAG: hemolysin family protein, partial [Lachnospiraceae bacterium]
MEYGCWPWIFIILLMISALIYGFEKAILGENETVLEDKAEEGDRHAVLLFKLYKQKASLTASRILLMFGIGAGSGIHSMMMFQKYHSVYALAELPAIWLFLEILLLVIRKATVRTGEFWIGRFANVIRVIMLFLKPLTFLVDLISDLLLRISGYETNLIEDVTEEEIISMVNEGNEQGVLEDSEAEMIQNIISFGDKEAGDIMTRRINVLAFEGHEPLLKVFDEMIDAGKSRFPVYDEELDNVIGVLYLHDAAKASRKEENHHKSLMEIPDLLRKPVFIPETVNIDDLFRKMQHQKIHMMLVVDEYGQLDGLVTMEDLLEEIVGNIFDEY